jgi:hypothetical protein
MSFKYLLYISLFGILFSCSNTKNISANNNKEEKKTVVSTENKFNKNAVEKGLIQGKTAKNFESKFDSIKPIYPTE